DGRLFVTSDSGQKWAVANSRVGSERSGLAFDRDGESGWAVGYPPALIKSDDGGATWQPMPWPLINTRYPAPWFWLMLIPIGFCLWKAFGVDPASATQGIEAMATSDAPIENFDRDRLQFSQLARGISRFLRNTNTRPPLTLSISGEWGSGKSTLMK